MAARPLHLTSAFDWHIPVAVRFGAGAETAIVEALGTQHAVLMTYAGALDHAAPTRLRQALGGQVSAVVEVPEGLASLATARALAEQVWPLLAAQSGGVLLAVGGGSVLDLAKLLRCRPLDGEFDVLALAVGDVDRPARRQSENGEFDVLVSALRGIGPWPVMRRERLWLLPTTAGTGSEVTRWATLWDTEATPPAKRSLDQHFGYAERAFVDPAFTLSCPMEVVRNSALDALAHALEALWNHNANPVSDALAIAAARRVIAALPVALRSPEDLEARHALSLAALEAGLAFSQTRTAIAHALSYALTLEAGTPHGLACAVWLPTAWSLAAGRDPAVDRRLAQVFDAPARHGAAWLSTWLHELGVDPRPEAHGVTNAQQRIEQALRSERGRNFVCGPV